MRRPGTAEEKAAAAARVLEGHRAWTLENVRMRTWLPRGPHVGVWRGPGHLLLIGGFWCWYPPRRIPKGAKRAATVWVGSDGPPIAIAFAAPAAAAPGPATPDAPGRAPPRRRPRLPSRGRGGIRDDGEAAL